MPVAQRPFFTAARNPFRSSISNMSAWRDSASSDSGSFSFIQAGHLRQASGVVGFKPCRSYRNPLTDRWRSERIRKFSLDGERDRDSFKQPGKQVDFADLD